LKNYLTLFFLLLFPFFTPAQEGNFKWQNPLPQGNDLNGCCCASGKFAWAVGNAGTIIKSCDKGANWIVQSSRVTEDLYGVSFADSLGGWACGTNGSIVHTVDGGETWELQTVPDIKNLEDIQFIGHKIGWVVGWDGLILHSEDAGSSWMSQSSNTSHKLLSLYFVDTLVGFSVGYNGTFLKTDNGGETWDSTDYFSTDYFFTSVFFINPDTGWVCGIQQIWPFTYPIVVKTTDGGQTWVLLPLGWGIPWDIYFTDPQHGYMAAGVSTVYETENGGESWAENLWGEQHDLKSLSFFDENYAIGVGEEARIIRKHGGPYWRYNIIVTTSYLMDITFTNDMNGWAVGAYNTMLHTIDGGISWNPVQSGFQSEIYWRTITFSDDQNGWVGGTGGLIIHTTDGGITWQLQTTNTDREILSVFFIDENYGWAVGENDTWLRSINGGQTWQRYSTGHIIYLNDVYFVDHQVGWMVGSEGLIKKSLDGGMTWVLENSNSTADLQSVYFTDSLTGWAVGDDSTILHTTDGGAIWSYQENSSDCDLYDVCFPDGQKGWISGDYGTLMHTEDGGLTWVLEDGITNNSLDALIFTDQNSGWVCGWNGTILNYHPDSTVSVSETEFGDKTFSRQNLHIFPNPCNSSAEVRLSPGSFDLIRIYNMNGSLIRSIRINQLKNSGDQDIILNIQGIPPGVYLIEAIDGKKSVAEKIIIF